MRPLFLSLFVVQLEAVLLPGPPGPYSVSYNVHSLTDSSRQDPHAPPERPHTRQVVISSYTPVEEGQQCDRTQIPYMPPNSTIALGLYAAQMGFPTSTFEDFQLEYCQSSRSGPGKHPVAIFSPGLTSSRLLYTVQSRALASLGYVVVAIDHPYDAVFVEFPDGTSVEGVIPQNATEAQSDDATKVRAADVSFLVDALRGSAPGVSLPKELVESVDLDKIFAYGHSMGGATAAEAALLDDRILGGLDFDGRPWAESARAGSSKPFVIVGSSGNHGLWSPFYQKFRGPKMQASLEGTTHLSFLDMAYLFGVRPLPEGYDEMLTRVVGTMKGARLQEIALGFLEGFADLVIAGNTQPLRGLNATFPEILVGEEDLSN